MCNIDKSNFTVSQKAIEMLGLDAELVEFASLASNFNSHSIEQLNALNVEMAAAGLGGVSVSGDITSDEDFVELAFRRRLWGNFLREKAKKILQKVRDVLADTDISDYFGCVDCIDDVRAAVKAFEAGNYGKAIAKGSLALVCILGCIPEEVIR